MNKGVLQATVILIAMLLCGRTALATPPCGATTLSASVSPAIVVRNSFSCNSGLPSNFHSGNSYWRAFKLADFGVSEDFAVCAVQVGIEYASSISGSQELTARLYTSSPDFPAGYPGSLTLLGSQSISLPDQVLSVRDIPVGVTVPAGSQLVVELHVPDGEAAGEKLWLGSNPDGELAPGWFSAPDCEMYTPVTTAAAGFPNMHMVINVIGGIATTTTTTTPEDTTTTTSAPDDTTTTIPATTTIKTTTTSVPGMCPAGRVLGAESPQLDGLRDFRDGTLAQSTVGRSLISLYYRSAETLDAALERSPALRAAARRLLETIAPLAGKKKE